MTEEEFLMSLPQSLNPNEKLKRLEQWRQENPQPEVEEEVEEVVEEKPMKLTFESATEPIVYTTKKVDDILKTSVKKPEPGSVEEKLRLAPGGYFNESKNISQKISDIKKELSETKSIMDPNAIALQNELNRLEALLPKTIKKEKEIEKETETTGEGAKKQAKLKFEAGVTQAISGLLRLPTYLNEISATTKLSDEHLAAINTLPVKQREAIFNVIGGSPNYGALSNYMLGLREEAQKNIEELNEEIYQYDTGIGEDYKTAFEKGDWEGVWDATVRSSVEAVGSIPSIIQAMIPYVGIASIVGGSAAEESYNIQKQAEDAKKALETISVQDPDYATKKAELEKIIQRGNINKNNLAHTGVVGFSEGLLELVTKGIGGRMLKNLSGASKPVVEKSLKQWGLAIIKDFGGEGLSESATLALNKASEYAILGDKQAFENSLSEFVDTAIVGGFAGGGMSATGAGGAIVRDAANNNRIKNIINKSDYNSVEQVFSTPKIDDATIELAQIPNAQLRLNEELKLKVSNGDLTVDQANATKDYFIKTTKAVNVLKPVGLSQNIEAVDLMLKKEDLIKSIKSLEQVSPKAASEQKNQLNETNQRLSELVDQAETERAETVGMSILPTRRTSETVEETDIEVDDSVDSINETLLETIKDPNASKAAQNQAQQALIDSNQNLYLEAVRFSTEAGTIPRNKVLEAINSRLGPIINNFDPAKGVTWSTYVTNSLKPKMQEIYSEASIGQRGVSLDTEGARQVADTQVETDTRQEIPQRPKVYPSQLEVVAEKLTPEVRETQNTKVKDEIIRSINDKGVSPDVVAKDIIKKTQEKEIRNVIKGAIGRFGSPQYNQFVDDVVNQDFINSLPLSTIKGRFGKLFGIEEISRTPTKKIVDSKRTDFKKQVFRIPKTTPETIQKIKDYFKANEKRSQSLFSILAEGAVVEEVQAMKGDTDFMNKLNDILELKGSDLNAEQFMDQFQKDADQRIKEDTSLDLVEDVVEQTLQNAIDNIDSFIQDQAGTLYAGLPVSQVAKALKSGLNIIKDTYSKTKDIVKSIKAGIDSIRKALGLTKKEADNLQNTFEQEITEESLQNDTLDTEYLVEKVMETEGLKRDKAFEQLIINNAIELESKFPGLKVILKKPSEKGRYRNFDFAFELNGFEFLGESKLDNAQYSSVNGTYDFNTGDFKFTYDKYSPELQSVMDNIVKKSKPKLNAWAKDIKKQGVDLTTSSKKIPKTAWMQAQKAGLQKATTTKETVSADVIAELYNKKQPPVYYINIQGQGLFYMGENPLNLPVPKLEGTVDMVFRFKRSGTDANGNITPTLAFVPANIKVTGEKSNFNLDSPKSFEKLMQTPAVQNILKLEDQARNKTANIASDIVSKKQNSTEIKQTLVNSQDVRVKAQKVDKKEKGLSAFDFDDTLALTKEKVKYTMPDGTTGELTAGEFAVQAEELTANGAEFDFSNFENVDISTLEGPMVSEAKKKQAKFGPKDIFVVTARPGASATAIQTFLKNIGLNIPLSNITGLGNGDPQAKADWFLEKASEGYNDFYFADDSLLNVQQVKNVLDQIDVKSDVQQAIADKTTRLNNEFNNQIEEVTGKESFKRYSDARARLEGKQKDKGIFKRFINQFTITPSADDFMGLMYAFMGKGEQGNKHAQFIKENLMDPYNKAEQELLSAKVTVANDFAALKDAFPTLKSKNGKNPLMQEIGVGPYTKSQGIRVYMWNKQGMEIPGMSKRDIDALVSAVESDLELLPFADNVMLVQKNKEYPAPTKNWLAGDITTDILRGLDTTYRKELMTEFNENSNIIFSPENLNKIEALYGNKFRESLVDSLRRMKSGSNRPVFVGSGARIVNEMMDWLNSSVGAVMFLNMRSGLLQLISNVNFINWGDNNVYNAAKAFTSKDYFPTVLKLMNSDYLVNRRDGLKINVNEAELADAGRQGGIKGMINYILDKGFAITRVMDSIAIATGGATFFINRKKSLQNRVNPETGKLYTEAEAESKAFDDFYAIAEETQQSSNPARISQQQASFAGRVILSFQNVTMQYNRKTKKSIQDLYNRRKKPGMTQRESDLSNLSSIIYYVGVQNLVFNGLQQALFALAFEDEPEEKEKANAASIANGMLDSLLFGLGFGGAIVSTVKNVAARVAEESEKKTTQYRDTVWNVFDISPVLDSKVRKLRTAAKTFDWNMDEIKRRGWSLDNPAYLAVSQIISATTNLPLDRVLRKAMNIGQAFDEETKTWQTVALLLGWSGWNVGLPYWGRESTIKKEEAEDEKLKDKFKNDVRKFKNMGFTKRIPLTGPNSGRPSGELGVDYIQIERPDGRIQYYKKP